MNLKGWTFRYTQEDYGTERVLTVYDALGHIRAQLDPCWRHAMPWSFKDHTEKLAWLRARAGEAAMHLTTKGGQL